MTGTLGLNRLLQHSGIDRPIFFSICTRAWSLLAGLVTLSLVVRRLSLKEQGYYYTFNSVLMLQWFLELGFSTCIIQFASHECTHLAFGPGGRWEGDPVAQSRLRSLARLAVKWYAGTALLLVVFVGTAGQLLFATKHETDLDWVLPWWLLCLACGSSLALLPFISLLEGCNRLRFVYGSRLVQAIAGSLVLWMSLAGGLSLYSAAFAGLANAAVCGAALLVCQPNFIRAIWQPVAGASISWRHEIWPLQWRLAVTWSSGYFIFNLFNPVLFYFSGATVAGQMGATWQMVSALSMAAGAWITTKVPRFGMLINQRRWLELDRLFRMATIQTVAVSGVGGAVFLMALAWVQSHFSFGTRFLPWYCAAILVAATITNQIVFCQGAYLRGHKREPFMALTVANGLVCALGIVLLGRAYGALGACIAYSATQIAVLPWATYVWNTCRKKWHA